MTEKKKKQPKRDRTLFRETLNQLMVKRRIYHWKDLRAELVRAGYDIGQSQLSQYINGWRDPEELEDLFAAISRVLNLTKEEKMLLAYSYAYPEGNGQSVVRREVLPEEPGLTKENERNIEVARREKEERDERTRRERNTHDTGDRTL